MQRIQYNIKRFLILTLLLLLCCFCSCSAKQGVQKKAQKQKTASSAAEKKASSSAQQEAPLYTLDGDGTIADPQAGSDATSMDLFSFHCFYTYEICTTVTFQTDKTVTWGDKSGTWTEKDGVLQVKTDTESYRFERCGGYYIFTPVCIKPTGDGNYEADGEKISFQNGKFFIDGEEEGTYFDNSDTSITVQEDGSTYKLIRKDNCLYPMYLSVW